MKTIVIFYSYTGHTKALAHELIKKESAEIIEIEDIRRPSKLKAYAAGCFAAMRGKTWKIKPIDVNLEEYERLILLSPVWAGNIPPAVNSLLEILPEGKTISVKMVSGGGNSSCKERLEEIIKAKSCMLESFEDIKG